VAVFWAFGWLERVVRASGRDEVTGARIAGWASALYAVHPVVGVPINYVCARDLLLMQMFAMGALNAWARFRELEGESGAARWAGVAAASLACAMLSKQNALAVPFVLLLFEWIVRRSPIAAPRTYLGVGLFAAIVVGSFLWTELVIGFSDLDQLNYERKWWHYPATMAEAHPFYYWRNALWPFEMRMLPRLEIPSSPLEGGVLLGAGLILSTLVVAWWTREVAPLISFAILAYWFMFAVTSSVRPFRYLAMDYRQVPSLPYLCLLASLGLEALRERLGSRGFAWVLLAYFALASVSINRHWRDAESLWGQAVRKGTRAQGHVNYGLAIKGKNPEGALEQFALALEEGPNIFAQINRGLTLISMGRQAEGLESIEASTRVAPGRAMTWYWLSRGHIMNEDPNAGMPAALEAVRLEPGNARYLAHLVRLEIKLGRSDSARRRLDSSKVSSPELEQLASQLGG
jgi:hypothetical protein